MIKYPVHDYSVNPPTVTFRQEHVGRSLFAAWQTIRVMSDVWDNGLVVHSVGTDGRINESCVSTSDMKPFEYEIDATESCYSDFWKAQYDRQLLSLLGDHQRRTADPSVKGRVVKVKSGRTAKGTVGKVCVIIERPYGMGYRSVMKLKLGIATSPVMVDKVMPNGKVFQNHRDMVWVWAQNCEVESPEAPNMPELERQAFNFATDQTQELRDRASHCNKEKGRCVI